MTTLKSNIKSYTGNKQVDFLLDIQCEKAQGFYFSRPIPAIEAEEKYLKKKK
ncbi:MULTISPECIES: hypothetical protein [Bacillaceae]|uniref:hypothetical protein n=1 Tax=Bacillaceae TaxID=186817 RepID=UPI001584E815|nr:MULTISPECIES: hypothetical protein [Bacillaceae]